MASALRASDINVMYVYGYGFPKYRGGPMYYADQVGLDNVYRDILAYHQAYGEAWRPSPLLKAAGGGRRFVRGLGRGESQGLVWTTRLTSPGY